MALPEHLYPKTYWEKRTELLEESVERMAIILINIGLTQQAGAAMKDHMEEWGRLIGSLANEFPPSDKT